MYVFIMTLCPGDVNRRRGKVRSTPLQPGPVYPKGAGRIRKAVNRQRLC